MIVTAHDTTELYNPVVSAITVSTHVILRDTLVYRLIPTNVVGIPCTHGDTQCYSKGA